jgi:murein DD-endopeptidase MepM/ murein hydrolase activator NlpD
VPSTSLSALALAGALALALAPAPPVTAPQPAPAPSVAPREGAWQWPLAGRPQVLRPFEPPAQRWAPGHRGVDLAASPGDPVRSPADGVVAFTGWVVDRPVVSVATADGLRVTLEPVAGSVATGTPVRAGHQVGTLAAAPLHCGPLACLHWGVRAEADRYLDPLAVLAAGGRAAPPVLLPLG